MLKSKMLGYRETCQMRPQKGEEMNQKDVNELMQKQSSLCHACVRKDKLIKDLWAYVYDKDCPEYEQLEARIKQEGIE